MYIDTIFGMRWRIPSTGESLFIVALIVFIVLIFVFIRLLLVRKEGDEHETQYILFRAKQRGLTNYQYKILMGMIRILKLQNASEIFISPGIFEKSIGSFIHYIQTTKQEEPENLSRIMKDIVITYEKLYLNAEIRKPLGNIDLLENGHFVFFHTDTNRIYLGQIATQKDKYLILKMFRKDSQLGSLELKQKVHCYLWRSGDAEYTFDTLYAGAKEGYFYLLKPEKFQRGAEVRLPFVSILLPCTLVDENDIEKKVRQATVIRLAENEVVFQASQEFSGNGNWNIEFVLDDFMIHSHGSILSEKNISDKKILYITFKFNDISEAARSVIKRYIVEHLPG